MVAPKLTTTWGAGFSFSKCHAERRVPYDPHLEGIFDGEEFSKMVRLWTNGYDVYTPRRSHLVHDYSHPNDATVRERGEREGTPRGCEGRGGERRKCVACNLKRGGSIWICKEGCKQHLMNGVPLLFVGRNTGCCGVQQW